MDAILVFGLLVTAFVAFNIGGATTGPAFGPAVGAGVISTSVAAVLMSISFFAGAWTIGPRVVDTLGDDLVLEQGIFTLEAGIVILIFVGGSLLVGNLGGVPASTSMTAVGSIAGFALALGQLNYPVIGEILIWWVLGPVIGFWVTVMIGRYLYERIDRWLAIDRSDQPIFVVRRTGMMPRLVLDPGTTRRELAGAGIVVGIGCLMAFSSGTSNIANAIAPLVGSGDLSMRIGIVFGSAAVAVGAFTIARRTLRTLGSDITDLPLTAAMIVAVVSSTIVILLSAIGIPTQFVVIATFSIVGLGWGRTTRAVSFTDAVRQNVMHVSVAEYAMDESATTGTHPEISQLFNPGTTVRVAVMQMFVPVLATIGTYAAFLVLGPI